MASNRSPLNNVATGELKSPSTKNALAGGKPRGSTKVRSRNDMYMEKLENVVSLSSKRKIESILADVNSLGDVEKMLLYLRLPTGFSESEASTFSKSSPSGPNSTREEHTKAFNWICTHLEESPDTSMRKSDVYEDYKIYCESFKISAVCAADFGKIMKGVFPKMKRRRLGTRGNSRYCYSGIRKKADMKSPVLPQLDTSSSTALKQHQQVEATAPKEAFDPVKVFNMASTDYDVEMRLICKQHPTAINPITAQTGPDPPCKLCPDHEVMTAAAGVLCSWEKKSHSKDFGDIVQCAQYLIQEGHIPRESDHAKVFITALEDSGKTPKLSRLDQNPEAWLQRSPEERRRETTHQLQLKLQQKQIAKDQQRREEEERRKSLGVQASESSIDSVNCGNTLSQSRELASSESTTETTQSGSGGGSLLVSPKPSGANSAANSKEKESPKKKLTPIQPKNPLGNLCLIPVPIPPTDNQPLKLIYMPNTGKKLAIPASMNLPGSQPLPGSPFISSQACQNALMIKNKVIVPVSQVQLQTAQTKPTVQCSNNSPQVIDRQRTTTVNIQGSKVNRVTPPSTLVTVNSQWQNQPTEVINRGIAVTVSEGQPNVIQTNRIGVMQGIIPTDTVTRTSQAGGHAAPTIQGIRKPPQNHTVIMSGNKQCGIISVPQMTADMATSPDRSNSGNNAVVNDMVLFPNMLSNNIPNNPIELVISQPSGQSEQSHPKYILSNPLQSSSGENSQSSLSLVGTSSVANLTSLNLEAILNQGVLPRIGKGAGSAAATTLVHTKRLNHQGRPLLTRGNSLPSSVTVTGVTNPQVATASQQVTTEVIRPSASNLLRSLTKLRMNEAVIATSKAGGGGQCQTLGKTEPQTTKQAAAEKDVKSSRLLEELLRPTPAKVPKANVTPRRNPQPRPKSVAGILENNKLISQGKGVGSSQQTVVGVGEAIAAGSSLYPSLSIHKKRTNKMQTVSGMSAAMMLPPEFRAKLEQQQQQQSQQQQVQSQDNNQGGGDIPMPPLGQGNSQMQVAFSPQGITLITQDQSVPGSPKIIMQVPTSCATQSQLLGMLPNSVASSPQLAAVGSPASNSNVQLLSAPSTPLASLGSPEGNTSRSSNNTPMSEIGSVPGSPAQPQQAQLFFVPINQGQGLDPALISVNNKSPVKPKQRQVFFARNSPLPIGEAPLDLSNMHEDVAAIQQMQQQNAARGNSALNTAAAIARGNSALSPAHQLNRKRHHSGGVLLVKRAAQQDITKSLAAQQHPNVAKLFGNSYSGLNTITDMPPPSSLPQMGLHLSKGKPLPGVGGRPTVRINTGYRKRNVSGPSIPLGSQHHVGFSQQSSDNLNIPAGASPNVSEGRQQSERERSLAKRSQSVPLPELSESLQNFIINTKIGEEMTASDPEEIEKSLKKFDPPPMIRRGIHASITSQFGAKRNLSTQLQSMVDQDQQDAIINEYLNVMAESSSARDENENPRSGTAPTHLIGSTGSGNCASSQTEIVGDQQTPDPQWSGLEQTLAQAQPSVSLVDSIGSTSLELQSYALDPFGSANSVELISPFSTSVTM